MIMNQYNVPTVTNIKNSDIIRFVSVPGSKSITNRALLLATLANGQTILDGVLFSDDSRHFLKCVQDLKISIEIDEPGKKVTINGCYGKLPEDADLYVGSAGTAARFLTAVLGVSKGTYHLDSSDQMKKRPMGPLLNSLTAIGWVRLLLLLHF